MSGASMHGDHGADGPPHGGRVQMVMAAFPEAPRPYVDLSTGINPHAYPVSRETRHELTRLPEPHDEQALRAAASHAYGVALNHVLAGPGTQLLIGLLPHVLNMNHAHIFGPTYGGHAEAWRAAGIEPASDETWNMDRPVVARTAYVVCRPNNPDGRVAPAASLRALADRCAECGSVAIVDEAFADLATTSIADMLPHPGLLVLRSFGKTYGLAGVRLGFLLGSHPAVERLRRILGPWAVSGTALTAGCVALRDEAWRAAMAVRLSHESRRLRGIMENIPGVETVGGALLFTLFRITREDGAYGLWKHLAQRGIVTRRFDEQPTWLRLGLPGDAQAWDRLTQAMAEYCRIPPSRAVKDIRHP